MRNRISKTDGQYEELLHGVRSIIKAVETDFPYWNEEFFESRLRRYLIDISLIEKNFSKGRILDVGASPCHLTYMLKRLGYDISGLDIDPGRIQKLLEITELEVKRCNVEVEPMPYEDETFDYVIMTELFEHLRLDPLFVLSEINRILKTDGFLYMSTPNLYGVDTIGKYIRGAGINNPLKQFQFLREKGHMGHMREYSNGEMKQLLGYSGFDTKKTYYHNYHKYDHGFIWLAVNMFQLIFPKTRTRQIIVAQKKRRDNPLSSLFTHEE